MCYTVAFKRGAGLRILVVEDDEAVGGLLKLLLTNRGHQVDLFTRSEQCPYLEGTACARTNPSTCAEVMIVDYQLPRVTGLEFLLHQEQNGCRVPRANKAVASALVTEKRAVEITSHGYVVLKKPFDTSALDDFLAQCEVRLSGADE